MDITTEYILMCEKAWEIQELQPKDDRTVRNNGYLILCPISTDSIAYPLPTNERFDKRDKVWIPRQDQLQDMLFKEETAQEKRFKKLLFLIDRVPYSPADIDSMDKYWLCIVMNQEYEKEWDTVNKVWKHIAMGG